MPERLERSVRFWMRAYPRPWRATRGEELFGLVVDLAAPGTRRLGLRGVVDLVRGGWATRLRGHPPVLPWLGYRFFNRRIPVAYRAWALDDIEGLGYPLRRLPSNWPMVLLTVFVWSGSHWRPKLETAAMLIVFSMAWSDRDRRSAAVKHVAAQPGESLSEGSLVAQAGSNLRVKARWILPWFALVLAFASVASVAVVALDAHSDVGVLCLVAALVVGLLAAVLARSRLNRLVDLCVDQPHRILRTGSLENAAVLMLLAAAVIENIYNKVTGQDGTFLGVVQGVAALVLLPGTLVALGYARRGSDADLTGSDVWSIAALGRLPPVDPPIPELRLLSGPVAEGAVVPPAPADPDDGTLTVSLP